MEGTPWRRINDALRTMDSQGGQVEEDLTLLTKGKSAGKDDNRDHKTDYRVEIILERPRGFPNNEPSRNDAYISKRVT